MSAHTPGPWSHYHAKLRPQYPLRVNEIHGPNGEVIVQWGGFDAASGRKSEIKANARLIAAAPELLEALIDLDEAYCDAGPDITNEKIVFGRKALIAARAAIAKATGEKS